MIPLKYKGTLKWPQKFGQKTFGVYFNATNHNYPSNPPTLGPIALRIDCGQ